MSTNFETLAKDTTDLDGRINYVQVFDNVPEKNHVLPRNAPWSIKVNWEISGNCAMLVGGDWKVRVTLESMGKGFEGELKAESEPVNSVPPIATRTYEKTIDLPAPDTIPNFIAGAYKLVVVINHSISAGGVTKQTRMTGFYESYLLEFADI